LARQGRIAEKIEPVVVVEGSGIAPSNAVGINTPSSGIASIPTHSELLDLASKTLDFSSKRNGAVFWSGADNMKVAQWWANRTGKTTLEQTSGGKYLDSLNLFDNLPGSQAAQIWDVGSVRFANGASGNVNTFAKGVARSGPFGERTWWKSELPALQSNPNVTKIRLWNWTMDPTKLP